MNDVASVLKQYSKSKHCDIWIGGYVKLIEKYRKLNILFLGKANNTQRHHIIPKSLGGDNSIENIVVLPTYVHILAHYYLFKLNIPQMVKALVTLFNTNVESISCQYVLKRLKQSVSNIDSGKPIVNLTKQIVYDNIHSACNDLNRTQGAVYYAIKTKCKVGSCFVLYLKDFNNDYESTLAEYEKHYKQLKLNQTRNSRANVKVSIYCLNENKQYECIADFARAHNVTSSKANKAIRSGRAIAGCYVKRVSDLPADFNGSKQQCDTLIQQMIVEDDPKIINLTKNISYTTYKQAANDLNVTTDAIYIAITQRFKCQGCWLVYPDDTTTIQQLDDLDKQRRIKRAFNSRVARGTKVLNKTTGEIYNSISEAARTIKVANAGVIKRAIEKQRSCKGNILVYVN